MLVTFKPNASKQEKYAKGKTKNHIRGLFWTESKRQNQKSHQRSILNREQCLLGGELQLLDQKKINGYLRSSGKSWEHYMLQKSWWNIEELKGRPFKRFPKIMAITSSLSNAEYIEISFKNSYGRITLLQLHEGSCQTTFQIQYYIVLQEKISIYSRLKKAS